MEAGSRGDERAWVRGAQSGSGAPQWSYEGYRIAYLSGPALLVVNGDGAGDRRVVGNAVGTGLPALAWRPGTHELAFKNGRNQIVLLDVDGNRVLWRRQTAGIEHLAWSDDGRRLLVVAGPPRIFDDRGRTIAVFPKRSLLPAAFAPKSRALALVRPGRPTATGC